MLGHLRRAPRDRLQRLRRRPTQLRAAPRGALQRRRLRWCGDPRRVPRLARPALDPPDGAFERPLRVSNAPWGRRGAAAYTRQCGAQGKGVRAVREGLVRVLDTPTQGEPQDRPLRGTGCDREYCERRQAVEASRESDDGTYTVQERAVPGLDGRVEPESYAQSAGGGREFSGQELPADHWRDAGGDRRGDRLRQPLEPLAGSGTYWPGHRARGGHGT